LKEIISLIDNIIITSEKRTYITSTRKKT